MNQRREKSRHVLKSAALAIANSSLVKTAIYGNERKLGAGSWRQPDTPGSASS